MPRWPRDRWISPTVLNSYAKCPKRVRLQHLDQVEPPWAYHVHLAKGRVAHNLLRDIAHLLKRGYPVPDSGELRKRARLSLPLDQFPSPAARETHAADIVRWVVYGSGYLARIPDPAFLAIEKNQSRELPVFPEQSPYTLMARPDVAVLRSDGLGPLVEIIDYKTGVIRPEPDPPVIMRFVARKLLREFGDPSEMRVRFTYLWLDHADRTEIDLSLEHCYDVWPAITRQVQALASETAWKATPSWLCHYCPYHQNICQEQVPVERSAV